MKKHCLLKALLFSMTLAASSLAVSICAPSAVLESQAAKITKEKLTMEEGSSKQLSISGVTGSIKWKSKDPAIATVTSEGMVVAVSEGTTKIIAKVSGNKYKYKLTVKKSEGQGSSSIDDGDTGFKKKIEDASGEAVADIYIGDFDQDGEKECFAITTNGAIDPEFDILCSPGNPWYVDDGKPVRLKGYSDEWNTSYVRGYTKQLSTGEWILCAKYWLSNADTTDQVYLIEKGKKPVSMKETYTSTYVDDNGVFGSSHYMMGTEGKTAYDETYNTYKVSNGTLVLDKKYYIDRDGNLVEIK